MDYTIFKVNHGTEIKSVIKKRFPHFRAVGHTSRHRFMLSIAKPALLYRFDEKV